jgi:hypothetical protein
MLKAGLLFFLASGAAVVEERELVLPWLKTASKQEIFS